MDELMQKIQEVSNLVSANQALTVQSPFNDHLLMNYYSVLREADWIDFKQSIRDFDSIVDKEIEVLFSEDGGCYRKSWAAAVGTVRATLISRGYTPLDQP